VEPQHSTDLATFLAAVHHDGSGRYVRPVGDADPGHLRIGDEVRLRVRVGLDDPIASLYVRTCPDGEQAFQQMSEVAAGPACRWWEATLRLEVPTTNYRFLVKVPDGHRWLNGAGLQSGSPTDANDFRLLAGYDATDWLADRIFYQIFPDRFANGDPTNDVPTDAWTYRGAPAVKRAWGEPPTVGRGALVEFFGGDLQGIEQHLDHLDRLGVNALYLTPIFDARSNHGYDIVDYDNVAAHLGGNEALAALRAATAARDIRLILDIAPNHIGVEHPWFQAARADAAAATAAYFIFRNHPDDYESWMGHDTLPKLDYRSAALRAAMYAGSDSVFRKWLRPPYSIDGWRLDVANMLARKGPDQMGAEVAREIRAAVKGEAPNAYLFGENTYDAIATLGGDQWDGVMNYSGFTAPVVQWLAGVEYWNPGKGRILDEGPIPTTAMVATLDAFRAAIPWIIARQQYNLVGSHDTTRIRTAVAADPGRLRAAFGLLLTYVGVPSIFYGDEVGLEGRGDILARRTMPWDTSAWDTRLLEDVRTLITARRTSPALREGGLQVLEVRDDTLAFLRDTDEEAAIVVANRGPAERAASPLPVSRGAIPDGTAFRELLSGATTTVTQGALSLPVMPAGIAVWMGLTQ
jgi:alpha-glucosidase